MATPHPHISRLFYDYLGTYPDAVQSLSPSGSARENFIVHHGAEKFIATYNDNLSENQSFFYFCQLFASLELSSPKILYVDDSGRLYLQSYLGDQTLSEVIAKEKSSIRVKNLVANSLEKLAVLQQSTLGKVDYSRTFEYAAYGRLTAMHDLYYFKFFFADILGVQYRKGLLLEELEALSTKVSQLGPKVLMLRDFQARNIMVDARDEPSFIDFQAAMEGPALYDAVSLLYQAKANLSMDFRQEMIQHFIAQYPTPMQEQMRDSLEPLVLLRQLQVLGAYGLRGLIEKKSHFLESIPQGIQNVQHTASHWTAMENYPILRSVINQLEANYKKKYER